MMIPFTYKLTKDNKLIVCRNNKQIKILKGQQVLGLLPLIKSSDEEKIQQKLAKLTGNYKRGNEKNNQD